MNKYSETRSLVTAIFVLVNPPLFSKVKADASADSTKTPFFRDWDCTLLFFQQRSVLCTSIIEQRALQQILGMLRIWVW